MLLLIAVLAVLSAAFLFWAAGRRSTRRELAAQPVQIPETVNLRPLFEPTRGELRAVEAEQEAREIAKREYAARVERRERIDAALNAWRVKSTTALASALLLAAAEAGDAQDFSRAAEEIIRHFREGGFQTVSRQNVADLLESHRLLLPVTERGSGTLGWLKEEVARLRLENSGTAAQKTS